ncbi:glycosyltransferase [Limosilactobacillus reuteri]|uniref:glycosyltransferase n=1 Tax=Limosilactobacillus reuteri TaxID=1598 RepID=UPI001E5A5E05|nr:glycosyltransferase [Limosilactobacillus reuteri]MCC4414512.1 glycosyltransferase [Limosilactobacillus reuteri]
MSKSEVCTIVVTFNPNIADFTKNIKEISHYPSKVIIVDNNSKPEKIKELRSLIKRLNLTLYELADNYGIGYAQNYAIRKEHSDYYFFLDQDSYVSVNQFNMLLTEFKNLKSQDKHIAALGPTIYDASPSRGKASLVEKIISSGSIISKEALATIGLMRDDFFIDYIDYEWCWRATGMGWHIYQSNTVKIHHETNGVLRKNNHTIDPIFRLFYIYRNATYIVIHEPIQMKIKVKLGCRLLGKLLFQWQLENKKQRLKVCLLGVKDGVRGRLSKKGD